MNELSIWTLKTDDTVEAVKSEADLLEKRLEEMLVQRPDMLERDIQLVGRQTPTAGGPSDLLGVDTAGRLVVFELKGERLTRDAVTQCIDYASALDAMDSDEELAEHIAEHSGTHGIEKIADFKAWYREQYEEQFAESEMSSLLPPRLVLIGLGVDDRAERMAQFLQARGVDISVLTFYGFQHGGETLLARQVEVEAVTAIRARRPRNKTASEKRQSLKVNLSERGLGDLFENISQTLSTVLPDARPLTGSWGVNFRLRFGGRLLRICHIWLRADGILITLHATNETYDTDSLSKMVQSAEAAGWHRRNNKDQVAGITIKDDEDWDRKRQDVVDFLKEAAELRRKAPAP